MPAGIQDNTRDNPNLLGSGNLGRMRLYINLNRWFGIKLNLIRRQSRSNHPRNEENQADYEVEFKAGHKALVQDRGTSNNPADHKQQRSGWQAGSFLSDRLGEKPKSPKILSAARK
jgi:hypothetical protein